MRKVDKKYFEMLKRMGALDLLLKVRGMPIPEIKRQRKAVQQSDEYMSTDAEARVLIDSLYNVALDHAYGREKQRRAGHEVM